MPYTYHLKDVNNHNNFFGTDMTLMFTGVKLFLIICLLIISQFSLIFCTIYT